MATRCRSIPTHPCRWNLGSFCLAPRDRFLLWLSRRRPPRCSRKGLWSLWTSQSRVLQLAVPDGVGYLGGEGIIGVGSPWLCHADEVQDGDCSICVRVYQEGGLHVLDRLQGRIILDSYSFGILAVSLVLSRRVCTSSMPCVLVNPRLQLFTRAFALVPEWAPRRGMRLLHYLDGCLGIPKSRTLLLQHQDLVLQLCKDLRIIVNWEKSVLRPSTCVQYLGLLVDTSLMQVFPSEAHLGLFWAMATSFLLLPSPPVCIWQQLLGHMASLEHFLPQGRSCVLYSVTSRITGLQWWTIWPFRFLCGRSTWRRFVGGSQRTGGGSVSLFRFLFHFCYWIPTCLRHIGEPTC